MTYLLLTIIISAFIYVIFHFFGKFNIDTQQAIVFNYFMCAFIGLLFIGVHQIQEVTSNILPALPYALVLGMLFITVFTFIGLTTQTFGVAVTSIADKLSLVLPVFAAFILYQDSITLLKVIGIILTIVAVLLALLKKNTLSQDKSKQFIYYPIVVFFGGGIISILLKHVQFSFPTINYNGFLIFLFGVAFIIGFVVLLFRINQRKTSFQRKSIIAGLFLGIPNYFSQYCLLHALNQPEWQSSVIFPVVNIGIVILSTIIGIWGFEEVMTTKNKMGIIIALIAISLLLFDQLYV